MLRHIRSAFAQIPQLEVGVRLLYWKVPLFQSLVKRVFGRSNTPAADAKAITAEAPVSLGDLANEIRRHGISTGDILIVHSSMQSLACTGASPAQVIEMLLGIVGSEGTLVMPAIPRYREAPQSTDRLTRDVSKETWIYDVQRTPPWTGALPHKLMKTAGAVRSRFPLNTVVALGKHAATMMERELETPGALPCGPQSAWAYCANHGAKILMLGVDLAHSLTMIHVAEDCHEADWPIKGWYRSRQFLVKDSGTEELVNVRERHPKWAIHYGERKLDTDLLSYGIAKRTMAGTISITSLDASALLQYLGSRRDSGYPYFLWKIAQ